MNWECLLAAIRQEALATGVPSIDDAGFALLRRLVCQHRPRRVLEIGTANGFTAFGILSELPDDGKVTTIELDPDRAACARKWVRQANVSDRLFVLEGDAAAVLPHLETGFDFVYLDAAKGQYLANLEAVAPLLSDGAVIVADDIFHEGWLHKPWCEIPHRQRTIVKRMREFIERLDQPPFYDMRIEHTGNGMLIACFERRLCSGERKKTGIISSGREF